MSRNKVRCSKFKVQSFLVLAAYCLLPTAYAQTSQTPKLTARTVKFFVTALGASCAQGELGFDSANKLQVCDPANTWSPVSSGDSISVNAVAAVNADFDDFTPGAPLGAINVKWQKDASSPNNLSAYVQAASATETGVVNLTDQTLGAGTKTFKGDVVIDEDSDGGLDFTLDSGNAAQTQTRILYKDRGTLKWAVTKSATGDFVILDDLNSQNRLQFEPGSTSSTFLRSYGSTSTIWFENNSATLAKLSGAPVSGETVLFLRYHNGFSEQFTRVTLDAADSCGTGYKCLRVPN